MKTLLQDLRYGARILLKHPVYTVVATLTLALGIGANSAIFSVVYGVLLRPLPFLEPERLVSFEAQDLRDGAIGGLISPPDFLDFREQSSAFEKLVAFQPLYLTITSEGAEPERLAGARVSSGFFEALGVKPLAGRTFLAEEEQRGRNTVVVIGYGLWQRRFGSSPAVVGKSIELNSQTMTIIGIMPAKFQHPREAELWVPIPFGAPQMSQRRSHFLFVNGRLKPGVTLSQAQSEANTIARHLATQYPDTNTNVGVALTLLMERTVGEMRSSLLFLAAAVGFVLLIACVNVANLSLTQAAARYKEVAIRAALGASRMRIIRQLLTESILIGLLGGVLGLMLAVLGVRALIAISPDNLPRLGEVTVDWRALGFTLFISLIAGALFGLAPALTYSKTSLTESLKEGARGNTAAGGQRLRNLLVISEIALSLVLFIGAGLLTQSLLNLSQVDPGFKMTNVLTMRLSLPFAKYPDEQQRASFFSQLLQRIETLPSVQAVGTVSELPLSGQENDTFFTIRGKPATAFGNLENNANIRVISPDYFKVIGIPLLKGRVFSDRDNLEAPKTVIVSESLVRRFLPGSDPIGEQLTIDLGQPLTGEIVGVVGNIRHSSLAREPAAEIYISGMQSPPTNVNLVVRAAGEPTSLTTTIRNQVRSLDGNLPLYNVMTMEQRVAESASQPRFRTLLLDLFALIALLLASIGIYGVISYSLSQRTQEIGLRMALGAQRADVLKLIIVQGAQLALIGIVIGVVGALMLTRLATTLLFGVSATDPLIFVGTSLLMICVALLACYIPARRATKVDPIVALRRQ